MMKMFYKHTIMCMFLQATPSCSISKSLCNKMTCALSIRYTRTLPCTSVRLQWMNLFTAKI